MSQKGNTLLFVLLAVLILAAVSLGAFLFLQYSKSNPASPTFQATKPAAPQPTSTATPVPVPTLAVTYVNPFDAANQFSNPFPNPNNPF